MMSSLTASPGLPCVTDLPKIMIQTHFPNQAPTYLRVLKFSLKFLAFLYCNGLHYLSYLPGQLHIAGLPYPLLAYLWLSLSQTLKLYLLAYTLTAL